MGGWTGRRTCDVLTEKGRQEDRGRWAGSVQAELGFQANQPLPLLEAPGSELRAVLVSLFLRPGDLLFRRRPDPGAGRGTFSRAWSSVWAAGPPSSHGGPHNCPSPNTPAPRCRPLQTIVRGICTQCGGVGHLGHTFTYCFDSCSWRGYHLLGIVGTLENKLG